MVACNRAVVGREWKAVPRSRLRMRNVSRRASEHWNALLKTRGAGSEEAGRPALLTAWLMPCMPAGVKLENESLGGNSRNFHPNYISSVQTLLHFWKYENLTESSTHSQGLVSTRGLPQSDGGNKVHRTLNNRSILISMGIYEKLCGTRHEKAHS
jgi:hypothetical protein